MRTAGLTMADVWAERVLNLRGVQTQRFERIPATVGVLVDTIELAHHGPDHKYRPYLHGIGEIRTIALPEGMPHGLTELTYPVGSEQIDVFYEFDDAQLVHLAQKGYFQPGFRVPDGRVTGVEWELPAEIDAVVLSPDLGVDGGQWPVVFAHVHRRGDLPASLETSGYDLAAYFDDFSRSGVEVADKRTVDIRSGELDSLFGEDVYDVESGREVGEAVAEFTAVDEFAGRRQEIEKAIEAERQAFQAGLAAEEGTPEHLYAQQVASSLVESDGDERDGDRERAERMVPSPVRGPVIEAGPGDVDFGSGDEVFPATGPSSLERRKAEVAARAAELDQASNEGGREY
ncbi:hypothetical protein GCM10009642_43570 [Nocardiopsis metallicus]